MSSCTVRRGAVVRLFIGDFRMVPFAPAIASP